MQGTSLSWLDSGIASHRILVADGDNSRRLLIELLEGEGHEVVAASESAMALCILGEQSIDLALLDVMMLGERGLSVCHEVVDSRNSITRARDAGRQSRPYLKANCCRHSQETGKQ